MAEDKTSKERKISKKARVEILLEDLTSKVDTILEGREITDNKIDRLEQKVDENKEELLEMIMSSSRVLHEKIDKVEAKLTVEIKNVEQKVDKMDVRLANVEQDVNVLKQDVKTINTKLDKVIVRQDMQEERLDRHEAKMETFVHPAH